MSAVTFNGGRPVQHIRAEYRWGSYPRLHLSYAQPGGGPVYRDHKPWWRDINGVGWDWRGVHHWLEFRRHS